MSSSCVYQTLLFDIVKKGKVECSRGLEYVELANHTVTFDMNYPFIEHPSRKTSLKFAMKEAAWILSGHQNIFHPNMKKYSDDGEFLAGAYGPKVLSQMAYVAGALKKDNGSRQAVMTIWERNPAESKDIPCTLGLQFRLHKSLIHTTVFMRSSDAWLGIPYDLFSFSMVSIAIAKRVCAEGLGKLTFMLGSSHLYTSDMGKVKTLLLHCPMNKLFDRKLKVNDLIRCVTPLAPFLGELITNKRTEEIFETS